MGLDTKFKKASNVVNKLTIVWGIAKDPTLRARKTEREEGWTPSLGSCHSSHNSPWKSAEHSGRSTSKDHGEEDPDLPA